MSDLFANPEIVKWAATIAATLVIAIVGVAISATGLKLTASQWKQARGLWKGFQAEVLPGLITRVDDPNDTVLQWLDRFIPGQAAPVLAAALPSFLRILADETEKQINEPVSEVNIGDAIK